MMTWALSLDSRRAIKAMSVRIFNFEVVQVRWPLARIPRLGSFNDGVQTGVPVGSLPLAYLLCHPI
jgi:hypothetical protein